MGMVNNELAYTGFTLIASAGNITGTISVYGFTTNKIRNT
jgi:hypothetical protein